MIQRLFRQLSLRLKGARLERGVVDLISVVLAVGIAAVLASTAAVGASTMMKATQRALVGQAAETAFADSLILKNDFNYTSSAKNPAYLGANNWLVAKQGTASEGDVDLRGFMVDDSGKITDNPSDKVVIVAVSTKLGFDRDGYPYMVWRTELTNPTRGQIWGLLQQHNALYPGGVPVDESQVVDVP